MTCRNDLERLIEDNIGSLKRIFADTHCLRPPIDEIIEAFEKYSAFIVFNPCQEMEDTIPFTKFNCIYFLMDGDYVLYVGQTAHLCARIATHIAKGKEFERVAYKELGDENLLIPEAFNIQYHNPLLNKEKPTESDILLMIARSIR